MEQKEKDLMKRIEEETKGTEIPKSLEPEQIEKKLISLRKEKEEKKHRRFTWKGAYTGGLAAAAFLICVTGMAVNGTWKQFGNLSARIVPEGAQDTGAVSDVVQGDKATGTDAEEKATGKNPEKSEADPAKEKPSSPESYDEVYACLENYEEQLQSSNEAAVYDSGNTSSFSGAVKEDAAVENAAGMAAKTEGGSHSETNVRQQGVDEGDTVKTDGSYLYVMKDTLNEISIVDIREDSMKAVGRIELEKGAQASEFYLTDDRLIVCYTTYGTVKENGGYRQNMVHAATYDISNPQKPGKLGEVTQTGNYYSSRITDGHLYLFSDFYVNTGVGKNEPEEYIPSVQGKLLPVENIYLPENHVGSQYMVVSSVALKNPEKVVDSKGIFYQGGQIYVSNDNIYLTTMKYHQSEETETAIQKISYRDGSLEGEAQTTVKGYLDDSFALDEYDEYLRMVVTRDNKVRTIRPLFEDNTTAEEIIQTNSVYVLDEALNMVGKIENLAENERVYSSRFMGETAYFVTFEQTDPLFSVDLSDPEHPKIIGKLKLPGFSDYLHPYGDGLLLGIGMDMDEAGVTNNGVKVSMYDISDPTDVKEVQKYVLKDTYGSPATYDYKAVLVDPEKGLIGFSAYGDREQYYLFSYDREKGFTMKMEEEVNNTSYLTTRGVFAEERLFVVGSNVIESYNLEDLKKLDDLII